MNVVQSERERNRKTAETWITRAAANGAQVVVLPEMWTCGYDFINLQQHAEPMDGPSAQLLSNLAERWNLYIVGGSWPIQYANGVANTSLVFSPGGKLVYSYRKVHLIGLMEEDRYLLAGDTLGTFPLDVNLPPEDQGVASTLICYDLRFPELARATVLAGAKVLFIPAQWPIQRQLHWDLLLRARAIENQVFVVGVNMSGSNTNDTFRGGSQVVDPWGNTVITAGTDPEIAYADIQLGQVDDVRTRVPSLRDRRPEVYDRLSLDPPVSRDS